MSHMTETLQVERAPLPRPLSDDLLRRMHAYWRAANYLSVGQIYLLDNPLLREPLKVEHTKPRDRKSTRLNSSHANISYAVFCLKKKKQNRITRRRRHTLKDNHESQTTLKQIGMRC